MQYAAEELPSDRINVTGNVQVGTRLPSVVCASGPPKNEL